MKNNSVYLIHIIEAIEKIEKYISQLDEKSFYSSDLVQDAVIRELQIVGEAARRIDQGVKDKSPQIAWSQLIGMRNILVHDYFTVDLDVVWVTLKDDLPLLKTEIQKLSQISGLEF